ncbi:hypothetical protein GCM10025857_64730 [Alicyclobacillus contaminans]|nr:Rid family hydrolase [Tetragenococcus osmophilus]GMA55116.1 hypothetical protein GCM10025857_64730 [Alicyclobacillus contaminans]GMA71111.1 hypothetical protein GCM10025885_01600 [Tetragenococcus osmophilus]
MYPDSYTAFNLSQGIMVDDLLFVSGQTGVNERGELLYKDEFQRQAEKAFSNLSRVLENGNSSCWRNFKKYFCLSKVITFLTIK